MWIRNVVGADIKLSTTKIVHQVFKDVPVSLQYLNSNETLLDKSAEIIRALSNTPAGEPKSKLAVVMSASCTPFSCQRSTRNSCTPEEHTDYHLQMVTFPKVMKVFDPDFAISEQVHGITKYLEEIRLRVWRETEINWASIAVDYCYSVWAKLSRPRKFIVWVPILKQGAQVLEKFSVIWHTSVKLLESMTMVKPIVDIESVMMPENTPEVLQFVTSHARQVMPPRP